MKVVHQIVNYEGLKIVQDPKMFNFSLDSVLLANFVTINKKINNILDIGCGNAPIPLILATKTKAKIVGVEIQKDVAVLAKQSVEINNLTDQITIINDDINVLGKKWQTDQFDVITCNPPFFKVNETSHLNDSEYKTIARHEVMLNLDQIFKLARKLLKNGGVIAIVHRPDRLIDIISAMRSNNIEPKRIRFSYPKKGKDANMVLVEGSKNGKAGLKILPPLYAHLDSGEYTKDLQKYFS